MDERKGERTKGRETGGSKPLPEGEYLTGSQTACLEISKLLIFDLWPQGKSLLTFKLLMSS